jgi:hypothetical protein
MQPLSGPGIGLPVPTRLYPTDLYSAPQDFSSGQITLPAGGALQLPRGSYMVNAGAYSIVQFLDPVTNVWRNVRTARAQEIQLYDGFNYRLINPLGCIVGGVITNVGSGAVQATTSIAAGAGNSVWQAVVGGTLGSVSIANAGAGFSIPPTVAIPGPAASAVNNIGGIQASAYASLANGTVSGVTLVNVGAGYNGTISCLLLPCPYDPNYIAGTTTVGSITFVAAGAGKLMGALLTNGGDAVSLATTLAVTGAGAAAITPVILQTVTAVTVSAAGATYGTVGPLVTSSGGGYTGAADAVGNPAVSHTGFIPIPVMGLGVIGTATIASVTILDGGLFVSTPNPIIIGSNSNPVTASLASLTFAMGTKPDSVFIQPTG